MVQPALAIPQPIPDLPANVYSWLEIDLDQISKNYGTLKALAPTAECAAVVKCNAYGLGLGVVSQRLAQDGCRHFFVAHIDEGITLRQILPQATIYVLSGCPMGMEDDFVAHNLIPSVNDKLSLAQWTSWSHLRQKKPPIILHVDTGMNRIGFDRTDFLQLMEHKDNLSSLDVKLIASHLACSPDPTHSQNGSQRELFEALANTFPNTPKTLADTAGIYLGEAYHWDLVRPGKGIFGMFKAPSGEELKQVFTLKARVVQTRDVQSGDVVGYGSGTVLTRKSTLATLGIGYGDGLDRRMANNGYVLFGEYEAPIIGALSMDYVTVDITDVPIDLCHLGSWAEITSPQHPLEDIAQNIGTISRELSTRLGSRVRRTEITS